MVPSGESNPSEMKWLVGPSWVYFCWVIQRWEQKRTWLYSSVGCRQKKSCSRGEFPIWRWKGALSSIIDDATRMSDLEYCTHFSPFVKTEKIDMWTMWRKGGWEVSPIAVHFIWCLKPSRRKAGGIWLPLNVSEEDDGLKLNVSFSTGIS